MIGGSLAKALRERGLCQTVIGYDRNPDELAAGIRLGVIDEIADSLVEAAAKADVIVLAVPVKVMESVLAELKPVLKETTVITDVGSVKGNVVRAAEAIYGKMPARFIPGHPIAGSEKVASLQQIRAF